MTSRRLPRRRNRWAQPSSATSRPCRIWALSASSWTRPEQGWACGSLRRPDLPAIVMNEVGERFPLLPTSFFQLRLRSEFGDVADAEVGDRNHLGRDLKSDLEDFRIEDAHPSDPNRFGARGEPQILHGTYCGINVGRRIRLAAQARAFGALVVAGDAEVHRG